MACRVASIVAAGVSFLATVWEASGCNCGHEGGGAATETETDASDSDLTTSNATTEIATTGSTGSSTVHEETIGTLESTMTSPTTVDPSSSSGGGELMCGDGTPVAGELCFSPPDVILSGVSTAALALADFDDDGALDLAAGHEGSVSIRFGNGDGTFGGEIEVTTQTGVLGLAVGDFDGQNVDLVIADSGADGLLLLLGNGDRTFQAALETMAGAGPRGLAVADFDGDDALDLAVANEGGGDIHVLSGDGFGGFASPLVLAAGTAPFALAAGNIDAAFGPDLAVANFGSSSVGVFLAANMGFDDEDGYLADDGPRSVALADFDGDGELDLASVHQDGATAGWFRGQGDGTFATATFVAVAANPRAAVAEDIDGDGRADLAVAMETGNAVSILRGDAELGLLPPESFAMMSLPSAIAVGDLDDDGALDIVTGTPGPEGGIAILLADP